MLPLAAITKKAQNAASKAQQQGDGSPSRFSVALDSPFASPQPSITASKHLEHAVSAASTVESQVSLPTLPPASRSGSYSGQRAAAVLDVEPSAACISPPRSTNGQPACTGSKSLEPDSLHDANTQPGAHSLATSLDSCQGQHTAPELEYGSQQSQNAADFLGTASQMHPQHLSHPQGSDITSMMEAMLSRAKTRTRGLPEQADSLDGSAPMEDHHARRKLQCLDEAQVVLACKRIFTHKLADSNSYYQRFQQTMAATTGKEHLGDADVAQPQPSSSPMSAPTTPWGRAWQSWKCNPTRHKIWATLSFPESSKAAWIVACVVMGFILLNTVTFCLESVPAYEGTKGYDIMNVIDVICLGVFTLELLIRIATCPDLLAFFLNPVNLIDIAAVVPFLVELMLGSYDDNVASQTRILRIVRLLRILRLLNYSSRFQNLQVVVDALVASLDVLGMLCVLLVILLVVFSAIMYFAEKGVYPFESIPATMWYTHVTLTTTGYGDIVPATPWGKLIAGIMMLCCIVTIALPISVIGSNFSTMWEDFKAIREAESRSTQVFANHQKLKLILARHCGALEDIASQVKLLQTSTAQKLAELKTVLEQSAELQAKLSLNDQSPSPEEWAMLDSHQQQIGQLMPSIQENMQQLELLLALTAPLQADELMRKLDSLHQCNKQVKGWLKLGHALSTETLAMYDDLGKLKACM